MQALGIFLWTHELLQHYELCGLYEGVASRMIHVRRSTGPICPLGQVECLAPVRGKCWNTVSQIHFSKTVVKGPFYWNKAGKLTVWVRVL